MRKFILLLFTIFITLVTSAQGKFPNDVRQFLMELQGMMDRTQNEKLISIGRDFTDLYTDLPADQKAQIYKTCNKLKSKKASAPLYGYYMGGIVAASNNDINSTKLSNYLTVCDKTAEKEGIKGFENFIKGASKFFIDFYLYKEKEYSYQIEGGDFDFVYVEGQEPESILDQYEKVEEEKEEEESPLDSWGTESEDDWSDDGTNWGEEESWEEETEPKENTEKEGTEDKIDYGFQASQQPPVTGPVIKIDNANIIINSPYDSGVVIENTSGRYMLIKKQFVGDSGTFDWSNNPDNEIEARVTLEGYNFKTAGKVNIESEGAKLKYTEATDQEVEGAFQYRSVSRTNGIAPYPVFMSYKSQVELKNIGEGIKYIGGLSLKGSLQSSKSIYGGPSTIIVSVGEEEKFRAMSHEFQFKDSLITSKNAYLLIHTNEDSLINYGMYLKYNHEAKKLEYYKGPKQSYIGPFFDTKHNVEITAEKLKWNLDSSSINFSMIHASNLKSAKVESMDFYTDGRFSGLQGIGRFHPLTLLMHFADKKDSDEVYLSDFVKFSDQPENVLKNAMVKLSREGYIHFTNSTGKIKILRKAKLYAAARRKKADWDQLLLYSKAPSNNITFDLDSNYLVIRGVNDFMISVAQNVRAEPDSGIVILKDDRDLYFNGRMYSGQFQFTGKNYKFDYNEFFINMAEIDSIRLTYNQVDTTGEKEENVHTLGNKLVYSSGVLYVDKKNNKSHKNHYPEYPIFDATSGAYVFFNDDEILNHAYDTSIFFRIPPFVVDSLNESDPNTVAFQGTFYGGDVIENFDETLKIMPDYSFGFVHKVPKKGHKVYNSKGILYDTLTLDKRGLRGIGKIEYLTTTVKSNEFTFYLDSAITDSGSSAVMAQGELNKVLYPDARVNNYSMNWKAMEDKMHISNRDSVIQLYGGKANLDGTLTATPTGTLGSGKAISGRATAESKEMTFSRDYFKARNANFYVKSADEFDSLATIKADSVFLDYNMIDQYADFGPEVEGMASLEFPYMQYKTSISNGRWDMVKNTVTMVRNREEDIYYSYFYSTHPNQDSLAFNADSAVCDLDSSTLNIFGVPYIKVADSKIVPDNNRVKVFENADIQSFSNAMVFIDTLNEYHTLDSGQIDIISRSKYTGEARYQYVNAIQDTFYIDFNEFRFELLNQKRNDNRGYTMSGGYVVEEDSFFISPRIQYYGDVELDARENFLYFKGFVKIDLKGGFLSDWFAFEGRINPADVKIDMADPKAADGTPLVTGLHIAEGDSAHLYSTFIALKEMEIDHDIMKAGGVFGYNPYQNEFRISDEAKEKGESLSGNVLVLNDSTSEVRYEGKFDFIKGIEKEFEIISAGNGKGNIKTADYEFNTLTAVNFKTNGVITRRMGEMMKDACEGLWEPYVEDLSFRIAEIAGDNPAELYAQNSGEYLPLFSVSSKFSGPLVFSDVNLKWSSEFAALYSTDTLSLANVSKTDINAEVKGFMEIRRTYDGEQVDIYLQPDTSNWLYLNYYKSTLSILSSDLDLNALVFSKSTVEKRSVPTDFAYQLGDFGMKEGFIYHYQKDYQGIKRDSIDYSALTTKQAELITSINEYMGGGKAKAKEEEDDFEEEDGFFDDGLDSEFDLLDDNIDTEENEELLQEEPLNEEESLLENTNDELQEEKLEEDGDDGFMEEDPWSEAKEKENKKKDKKKKDKDEKEIEEEESLFLDSEDELLEEEEPVKEELLEEEESFMEEDPWSEAKKKEKKKKDKKKKEESKEEESLFESLDEELDDLD